MNIKLINQMLDEYLLLTDDSLKILESTYKKVLKKV